MSQLFSNDARDRTRMTRHRAKTIQRQQQTLDAAMRIVLEEGPDHLTIVRIAKEIGASVGGLYRYFPSKEVLIFELQKQAIKSFDEFQEAMIEAVDVACSDCSEEIQLLAGIVAAAAAYPAHRLQHKARHRLLTAFLATQHRMLDDAMATSIQESIEPILTRCVIRLKSAAAGGAINKGPALPRTTAVWAGLHGLDDFRKRDRIQPESLRVSALLPLLLNTFLVGFGAKPEAAKEAIERALAAGANVGDTAAPTLAGDGEGDAAS